MKETLGNQKALPLTKIVVLRRPHWDAKKDEALHTKLPTESRARVGHFRFLCLTFFTLLGIFSVDIKQSYDRQDTGLNKTVEHNHAGVIQRSRDGQYTI